MWHCERLGIVWVFLGHKKNGRRYQAHTHISLYHWGRPSLQARGCDLRDNDPNASTFDPLNAPRGETWVYVGNVFEMLPYTALTGHVYERNIT
jgi:hypothetical protein